MWSLEITLEVNAPPAGARLADRFGAQKERPLERLLAGRHYCARWHLSLPRKLFKVVAAEGK
jgi:hypothetical protein